MNCFQISESKCYTWIQNIEFRFLHFAYIPLDFIIIER